VNVKSEYNKGEIILGREKERISAENHERGPEELKDDRINQETLRSSSPGSPGGESLIFYTR
jgi:hypothetical protein